MAGRVQKPPDMRTGHRATQALTPIAAADVPIPAAPARLKLSADGKKRWKELWSDPIIQTWSITAVTPMVIQYIALYDLWIDMVVEARLEMTVTGSKEQDRANPLIDKLGTVRAQMERLERDLFLGPRAELEGGISRVRVAKEIEKLNNARGRGQPLGPPGTPPVAPVEPPPGFAFEKPEQPIEAEFRVVQEGA